MNQDEKWNELLKLEESKTFDHLDELENKWLLLVEDSSYSDWQILIEYNRFRLRNLTKLSKSRPAVLIGAINDGYFPNFHTIELLRLADVVSLTTQRDEHVSIDRIKYSLLNDTIQSVITKLPKGFRPLFFWDSQAEHGHPQPMGLFNAPFPTVASICNVFYSSAIKRLMEIFDYVLPVGRVFDEFLSEKKSKVLQIPFGLNWASMHDIMEQQSVTKDIDVSITFSKSDSGPYGKLRNDVISKLESLKNNQFKNYNFTFASDVSKEKYKEILNRSKISVNVVGFNGPYNYRSCEIMNSGALLFQINVNSHNITHNPEELFKQGEHFVSFTLEEMENKLKTLLDDLERVREIAINGKNWLESKFNYKILFKNLIDELESVENLKTNELQSAKNLFAAKFKKTIDTTENTLGDFHNAVFLWEQIHKPTLRNIGVGMISKMLYKFDDSRFFCNLLAILPEISDNFGFSYLKSLIASRDKSFAESLPSDDLKQVAIQIYSLQHDHVVMTYNMISLSLENEWIDKNQLPALANQAFGGKDWHEFDMSWILRYPVLQSDINRKVLYDKFQIPLLLAKDNNEVWKVYRDYLLHFASSE